MEPLRSNLPFRVYRVLVVEDNVDAVQIACLLLRELGHIAEYALNGSIALEVARRFKPDFAFVDIGLPGVDGFDVCRQLRRDPELMKIKIAILSAYDTTKFRELATEIGCEHYFVKPLAASHLGLLFGDAQGRI
jgi:CheY-like chemotaxis protein